MIMELTSQTYGILEVKKASGVIWSDPFIWQAASRYRQGDGVKGSDQSAGLIKRRSRVFSTRPPLTQWTVSAKDTDINIFKC